MLLLVIYFIPKLWLPKDTYILGIIKWQGQHFQKCLCKELEVNYDILYELDVFDFRKFVFQVFVAPGNPVVNNWLVQSPVLFLLQRKEVFYLPPYKVDTRHKEHTVLLMGKIKVDLSTCPALTQGQPENLQYGEWHFLFSTQG